MGRLSAYAKNRILKLRFKKNKRIIHIVEILKRDDNIKVSRQAVSTFLKKYLETNSIYDKPRTGRKRKLTQEEIQLIGQVTRLNRDITARAIKEYLNLNVSTYTILRATKLFEWNKVNPNSNDSKKAAALERQLNGESDVEKRRSTSAASSVKRGGGGGGSKPKKIKNLECVELKTSNDGGGEDDGGIEEIENVNEKKIIRIHTHVEDENQERRFVANNDEIYEDVNNNNNENNNNNNNNSNADDMTSQLDEIERIQDKLLTTNHETNENEEIKDDSMVAGGKKSGVTKKLSKSATSLSELEKIDLQLIEHKELLILKNLSCSPMSFATKILFKIFKIDELHGHNVSGKTLNKNIKTKLPLDPIRIGYIKYLVESYYDEKECRAMLSGAITHKQDLWKSCHTAINKSILISERKAAMNLSNNNTTAMTSLNDSIGLNATNLTTSENDETTRKKTPRKSKLDHEKNSTESDDDDEDGLEAKPKERKLVTKNSANTTSVLARNRASHNKSLNDNSSDALLKPAQKRLRRFKSDESSSSCSSFDFGGGGGFLSEEFDSCEDENNENSDDVDDDELESKATAMKKANYKLAANKKVQRPRSGAKKRAYTKKRTSKIFNEDTLNYETDSDEEDDDDEEDCQNEIELIQNIEKRLLNSNTTASSVTVAAEPAVVAATTPTVTSKTRATPKLLHAIQTPKENKISSSEASAAANIAAAMKKRIVVIGPDNVNTESDIEHVSTSITTTTTTATPTTTVPKSSSSITINKKVNSTPSNSKVENSPSTTAKLNESSNTDAPANKPTRSYPSRTSSSQAKTKTSTTTTNPVAKKEPEISSSCSPKNAEKVLPKKSHQSISSNSPTTTTTTTTPSNEQRITRSSLRK